MKLRGRTIVIRGFWNVTLGGRTGDIRVMASDIRGKRQMILWARTWTCDILKQIYDQGGNKQVIL